MSAAAWAYAKRKRIKQLKETHGAIICEKCAKVLTKEKTRGHHIIELSSGGTDTVENCEIRCSACEDKDPHRASLHKS